MWSFAKTHPTLIAAFGMCQILSVDRVPQIPFDSLCTVLVWSWIWKGIALNSGEVFILLCFSYQKLGLCCFVCYYRHHTSASWLSVGCLAESIEFLRGEGAFFPLVFYSAARLPGSLVQVLNQTLIPSTATGRGWFVAMQRHKSAKKEPVWRFVYMNIMN